MDDIMRLSQVQDRIHRALVLNFPEPFWIRAEMVQVRQSRGHYYLQLVEKAEGSDERIAQADAVMWASQVRRFPETVRLELGRLLVDGHELAMKVRVDFHILYGLKLVIEELDVEVIQGGMARRRQEIVDNLRREGLLEKNHRLPFPSVILRIAVITSDQAAGWQDFHQQLTRNPYGLAYAIRLFPASMQGTSLEGDVVARLTEIAGMADQFDVCVIIRGGGSKLDLAWFDNSSIGRAIADMPIPVLTGIGHETDETVCDLVAARSLKTPTAVAAFLLENNLDMDARLADLGQRVLYGARQSVLDKDHLLDRLRQSLGSACTLDLTDRDRALAGWRDDLQRSSGMTLDLLEAKLDQWAARAGDLDPDNVLARGFSMTLFKGHPLRSDNEVRPGDTLTTYLEHGILISNVTEP